jgi:ring-1,2-phenylacetyl-CoA epoxidase subunit PaaE
MADFHKIKVAEVIAETDHCVSILFDIPEDLKADFEFTAGQYLTIKASIDDEEVRRAYSIYTAPHEDQLGVSVKIVEGGKMSTYLNKQVKKGDVLEVMRPDGRFTLITLQDTQRDHYFFAAGSGVTPVMSMIKSMLEQEPKSTAYLLYGNKDEDNIIFKDKIDYLKEQYEGQIVVEMTLSQPKTEKSGGIMGILGKKKTSWNGQKGRIDSAKVARFVQENPPKSVHAEYYICGPGAMIETVQTTLMGNGVDKSNIHQEYFTSTDGGDSGVSQAADGAKLIAKLGGKEIQLTVAKNKSLLDTMLDAGHEAPYSCTSGACSTCMAKLTKGTVEMEACFALDDDEIADGYILSCQAHPTSTEVEVDFDV